MELKTITIDKSLDILPNFDVYAFRCDVRVDGEVPCNFDDICNEITNTYKLEDLLKIEEIKDARCAYKTLKADPNRVHLSCEGLIRRLLKGNKLYNVNCIVDAGNLVSIKLKRSVCVCDYDKLKGNITISKCPSGVKYYGINRGEINVCNLPIYNDDISYFGNPTSDIERTMITNDTKSILVMVINFSSLFDKAKIKEEIIDIFKDIKQINLESINEIKITREE